MVWSSSSVDSEDPLKSPQHAIAVASLLTIQKQTRGEVHSQKRQQSVAEQRASSKGKAIRPVNPVYTRYRMKSPRSNRQSCRKLQETPGPSVSAPARPPIKTGFFYPIVHHRHVRPLLTERTNRESKRSKTPGPENKSKERHSYFYRSARARSVSMQARGCYA